MGQTCCNTESSEICKVISLDERDIQQGRSAPVKQNFIYFPPILVLNVSNGNQDDLRLLCTFKDDCEMEASLVRAYFTDEFFN